MTIDTMIAWASRNGRAGQLVLAKLLAPSPTPETVRALEGFGADSMLGDVLASEVSGGVIVGDVAQHYAASSSTAEGWANDAALPRAFRDWAARVVARERAMQGSWEKWRREEELLRKLDR